MGTAGHRVEHAARLARRAGADGVAEAHLVAAHLEERRGHAATAGAISPS
jgi:hypothetical protein